MFIMQRMLARGPGQSFTSVEAHGGNAPVVLAREHAFRIGEAEFRPGTRELVFDGKTTVIEPRVMQVLVALHRARGAVVSKDDLQANCWENRIVGEDAINRVISRLRAVAERQGGRQFRIETITKVGYRLVTAGSEAGSAPGLSRTPVSRRGLVLGGVGTAVIIAGGAGWFLTHRDPMPLEARRLYTEARSPFFQNTTEQTANTIGKLKQALEIAPDNADILGLLGFAYVLLAARSPPAERSELSERGFSAARRALSLDPDQPDALAAFIRGSTIYGNWEAYERKCRAALERNPRHDLLNILMSGFLMGVGRLEEGLHYAGVASRVAPDVPPLYWQRCFMLWNLGRLDEADALLSRAVALWPRNPTVWFTHFYYLMYTGHPAEAAALVANRTGRPPGVPDWHYDGLALQAKSLAANDSSAVRATIEKWNDLAPRSRELAQAATLFAGFVGDNDTAFRLLDGFYFNRGFRMPDAALAKVPGGRERETSFLFARQIAGIRRDPRFAALTREIGLDDYWRRSNSRSLVVA